MICVERVDAAHRPGRATSRPTTWTCGRSCTGSKNASGPRGRLYRSFRGRLDHLATLTRNPVRLAGTSATVPTLTQPTSTQRQAFDLIIGVPIPLILK